MPTQVLSGKHYTKKQLTGLSKDEHSKMNILSKLIEWGDKYPAAEKITRYDLRQLVISALTTKKSDNAHHKRQRRQRNRLLS